MNTQNDSPPNNLPEGHPEKFPNVRTYPKGWDLSDLTSPVDNTGQGMKNPKQTENSSQRSDSPPADLTEGHPEKFPKVRTYPKGWDISGLSSQQ